MKAYKLRHKPTQLYYRSNRYCKEDNLSDFGEIYARKPSLAYCSYAEHKGQKLNRDDFEVVEFDLIECGKNPMR